MNGCIAPNADVTFGIRIQILGGNLVKFGFEIQEISSVQHVVEADNLMDAEEQIEKICRTGHLNAQKYGDYSLNIKLVRISNY